MGKRGGGKVNWWPIGMSGALAPNRWIGAAGLIRSSSEYVALSASDWRGPRTGLAGEKRGFSQPALSPPPFSLSAKFSRRSSLNSLPRLLHARAQIYWGGNCLGWAPPWSGDSLFFRLPAGKTDLKSCGEYLTSNRRTKLTKKVGEKEASATV